MIGRCGTEFVLFKLEQSKRPLRYYTGTKGGTKLHLSVRRPSPGARQTGICSTTPCTPASPAIWCQHANTPHGRLGRTFQHHCANFQHLIQPAVKHKFNVLQPSASQEGEARGQLTPWDSRYGNSDRRYANRFSGILN
jgi:hypothetical protein